MAQKEDFLGFTFGKMHSSDLNIVRTSDGDRFDEQIIPEVKDIAVEVPGMDGQYFFGSTYGSRTFEVSFAFDHLTESDFRRLRQVYGRKYIDDLIFDERPYKKYLAKIESPIELSYICFDEPIKIKFSEEHNIGTIDTEHGAISGEVLMGLPDGIRMVDDGQGNRVREKIDPWVYKDGTERIYKGEGKLTFVTYFPFAKSCFKVLPQEYENSDWVISSGILTEASRNTNKIDVYENNAIKVYNAGDVPTGFRLYLPMNVVSQQVVLTYQTPFLETDEPPMLVINPITPKAYDKDENENPINDMGVLVDTNSGLITGVKNTESIKDQDGNATYETSGNLYNEYVDSGYFFKLQPDSAVGESVISINGGSGIQIFYDYLYF